MNVVVVGGGTAGCISALLFKKKFPSINLTMIRSKEIGVLGPGEGLTPAINSFLDDLNISIEDFILNTGATVKHGVMFNNWDKDGSSWFHGFYDFYNDKKHTLGDNDIISNYQTAINLGKNLNDVNYLYHLVLNKKINLEDKVEYGFHIDARKLAIFLEKIAENLGITIIDDKIKLFVEDNDKYINKVITINEVSIDCDFLVDCSGFEKIGIQKHYKTDWISMSHLLPATNALACFLPADDKFYPYTDATAMKYGWSWKIPLQHRYGCGYVYDGKYINKDQAEKELIELYGKDLQVVGNFEYSPGFCKETWIKNCFANGLSSAFFEPIEATTISSTISQMYVFLAHFFPKYVKQYLNNKLDHTIQDSFNSRFVENQKGLASLLHFHYRTNREDTPFWKSFKSKYPLPTWENINLEKFIKDMDSDILDKEMFKISNWQEYSWMSIYAGNMMHIGNDKLDRTRISEYNKSVRKAKDVAISTGIDHLTFLNKIKTTKEKT